MADLKSARRFRFVFGRQIFFYTGRQNIRSVSSALQIAKTDATANSGRRGPLDTMVGPIASDGARMEGHHVGGKWVIEVLAHIMYQLCALFLRLRSCKYSFAIRGF